MWIPSAVLKLFQVNYDEHRQLREDLTVCRVKCDILELQLVQAHSSFNWLCIRVNDLENQNKALIEKAIGIKVPAPQIAIKGPTLDDMIKQTPSFEDIGDELAKKLGIT